MTAMADRIMARVHAFDRGAQVFCAKDFLDLTVDAGSRAGIDQALSRLVKSGDLRRVGRGLYDCPRISRILDRPAPANLDAVVAAVGRRSNAKIAPSHLAAANALGLTNAVPTRPDYICDRILRDVKVGGRSIHFKDAGAVTGPWLGTPAQVLVQALVWLRDRDGLNDTAIQTIAKHATDDATQCLRDNLNRLPSWALVHARKIIANRAQL